MGNGARLGEAARELSNTDGLSSKPAIGDTTVVEGPSGFEARQQRSRQTWSVETMNQPRPHHREEVVSGVLDVADGSPSAARTGGAKRSRALVDVPGDGAPLSTVDSGFEVDVFYVRAAKSSRM